MDWDNSIDNLWEREDSHKIPSMHSSSGGQLSEPKEWQELSAGDKYEIMGVAIKNGVTDLPTIRKKWSEFAKGGKLSDKEYLTIMEKVAKENNSNWNALRDAEGGSQLTPDEELVRLLNDNSYDYRGYYDKYPESRANADTHWPDEFKTVWHPTFSNESKYSGIASEYNPTGLQGGYWVGETFVPSIYQMNEQAPKWEGPIVDSSNYYDQGGFLEWLKGLFTSEPEKKYKAADGSMHATKEEVGRRNAQLIKSGRAYFQKESKIKGIKQKVVPRQPNTSPTSKKSTALENEMYTYLDGHRNRVGYRTKAYDIPYGEREIKVLPKGSTLSTKISVNALDSIAKYAGITGTPIKAAIGLPYQETTFGKMPAFNYEKLGKEYSSRDLGNTNYFKNFGSIPAEYLVRDFRYNGDLMINGRRDNPIALNVPPLQHAFEYYNSGNYNRGDENHTPDVEAAGDSLWNETTGNLSKWWKTEGREWYEKGSKQRKK